MLLLLVSTIVVSLSRFPSASAVPAPYELTKQQKADYRRDGVIVVRGMLEGETLEGAIQAAHTIQKKKAWSQRLFYKMFPVYSNLHFQTYRKHTALKQVAFDSTAPTIVAKLMGLDEENDNVNVRTTSQNSNSKSKSSKKTRSLRLLKDAIMGFGKGDMGCGWHVDDKSFWPCEDSHDDNKDNPLVSNVSNNGNANNKNKSSNRRNAGINVWISLSEVTAKEGGGLAVAPGSHNLTGKGRAGRAFQKARRAIASAGAQTTCALAMLEPTCQDHLEKIKRVYDLQPGDAIIHDRYLFHKPDNFKDDYENNTEGNNEDAAVTKQRISLRYMPSDATFFDNGAGIDGAAVHKNLKTGDSLEKAGEYFPQAWPCQLEAEAKASTREDGQLFGTKTLIKFAKVMLASKMKK